MEVELLAYVHRHALLSPAMILCWPNLKPKLLPRMPLMSESEEGLGCKGRSPTIGILTALELEFVAVKAMLDEVRDYDVPR